MFTTYSKHRLRQRQSRSRSAFEKRRQGRGELYLNRKYSRKLDPHRVELARRSVEERER